MLLKQLSDEDKYTFLCLAELLSLSDKPIFRDETRGNAAEVEQFFSLLTSLDLGLKKVKIQRDVRETQAVAELFSTLLNNDISSHGDIKEIERALIKRINTLPLHSENDPVVRVRVATDVLREILKNKKATIPSVPKLMLFELMMLALTGGSISSIRWQVLSELKNHYQLEDYIFHDLLERAQSTHLEAQKTIAIILE